MSSTSSPHNLTRQRQHEMLITAMQPLIPLLEHPEVTEVMLNPDGKVWIHRSGQGMQCTRIVINTVTAERIIRLIASSAGVEITPQQPWLAAKLPLWGARVQASIPPYSVDGPTFNLRLPARKIYTLADYQQQGTLNAAQVSQLQQAIHTRQNIIVAGGTGSGKTTLVNALLHEITEPNERIILIEDNLELQCKVPNLVRKLIQPPELTLSKAIFDSLREYPSRIIVGEVRDKSAYDLISVWHTGHPGNICTVHASSAEDALHRLNRLAQQGQPGFDFGEELERMVGCVVFIAEASGHNYKRMIKIRTAG